MKHIALWMTVLVGFGSGCGGQLTAFEEVQGTDAGLVEPDAGPRDRVAAEVCGNGLDDNSNGYVDEGCSCKAGQSQACWPGDPKLRHVGSCKDGVQNCVAGDPEFPKWGACVGAVTECGAVAACVPTAEVCNDGKDNDCDGKIDCQDPDCAAAPACAPKCVPSAEVCNDGKDNDCDGKIDCQDPDCASAPNCQVCVPELTWEFCGDGKDNDCNGKTDCEDEACASTLWCVCTETCDPGVTRYCDGETFCHWGVQTCGPDHQWGVCNETNQHPAGCTGPLYSTTCCEDAGACCEKMWDHSSVGNCPGVQKTCHDAD